MTPLENYLRELRDIHALAAGVPETSYYPALSNLLNEIGKSLKPKVKCITGLADRGAGLPDGGLFTADQFPKKSPDKPQPGQLPARGVIEVKPAKDDAWVTASGEQVTKYWNKYRQVLVTNYRDFILVGQDRDGRPARLETFRLAEDAKSFWRAAVTPRALDQKLGERFVEFLRRVMLQAASLAAPEDVAWFLASYAREARSRIEAVQLPALAAVRSALEEALGLKFEGEKGEHFFRSSLVQTLFYGVFSAWVLWAKKNAPSSSKRFDWRLTSSYLRVPMISKLFYLIADPSELENLNLIEVLDWTGQVLNRVDRASFFDRFQESHAVQYFYEPFLESFDPELRKELGVWYTPPEIVEYMVERVDRVLRSELGLPLGLADHHVYVLDPCCGTGSYLVEVLNRIHRTLKERGEDALIASDLKEAAQKRVFGFEILPAPFVVSHLQLGLLLQNLGAPLSVAPVYDRRPGPVAPGFSPAHADLKVSATGAHAALKGGATTPERVGVYLTNALTGWEPPKGPKKKLLFTEMEEERDAAEHVKREVPILVILGNPPYNAFAGVSPEEEQGLVEPYKEGLISEWGIKKFNLDDLYVRFFRLAERRIVQGPPGRGIVCFISNFSYLGDPSFVVMRKQFLEEFDKLWFDCMNGDSRETGKLTPEGKPDPSVFSTAHNREGIRVGTTIGLLVRAETRPDAPPVAAVYDRRPLKDQKPALAERRYSRTVRFRHFWGVTKNSDLVESLGDQDFESHYQPAQPDKTNRYSFRPVAVSKEYIGWSSVVDWPEFGPALGILENRNDALSGIDREPVEERMRAYFDVSRGWDAIKELVPGLTRDAARFDAKKARAKLLGRESYRTEFVRRFMLRPMDVRWCYYSHARPLWNEPRPAYVRQCWNGNGTFMTRRKAVANPEGIPFFYVTCVGNQHAFLKDAYHVPLRLLHSVDDAEGHQQPYLSVYEGTPKANLSLRARAYLAGLGIGDPDADAETAGLVWMHALAIGYSPAYLSENADGIRQDWPRIPLPDSKELLEASAALGKQIAALLDTETPFDVGASLAPAQGRPQGSPLQDIAAFTLAEKRPLREKDEGDDESGFSDFSLTAGWGHAGKGGVTMPGKGKTIERDLTESERHAVAAIYDRRGPVGERSSPLQQLGERTLDVYLNNAAYWKNIPVRVWEYTIGGYQVIKKWLSYRERKLLGRTLRKDEIRYVSEMACRIAAILLLEPALDANYRRVKEHPYPWPR